VYTQHDEVAVASFDATSNRLAMASEHQSS
jgi:hypothetical protein